jgi:hypothetical protein
LCCFLLLRLQPFLGRRSARTASPAHYLSPKSGSFISARTASPAHYLSPKSGSFTSAHTASPAHYLSPKSGSRGRQKKFRRTPPYIC